MKGGKKMDEKGSAIPPLAFALLVILLIILVIAFVPEVQSALVSLITAAK